jgi:hypothetical protein
MGGAGARDLAGIAHRATDTGRRAGLDLAPEAVMSPLARGSAEMGDSSCFAIVQRALDQPTAHPGQPFVVSP